MRRIFLLPFMLLTTLIARAQTLDECCNLARNHYPEIRQYNLIAET